MQLEFISHLKDNHPYLIKEKSIVCCSGGIDSVVLLKLMQSISKNFVVAHCNFKLRGDESNGDQEFVEIYVKKIRLNFLQNLLILKK